LRRQDFHLQVQQLVSLRSLPWVPGTSVPHLPDQERTAPSLRYYAPLRLPLAHRGGVRCSLSFPDPLDRVSGFVSLGLARLMCEADASSPRRESSPRRSALLHLRCPQGDHVALPSSRVTPLKACPALRPRWCPASNSNFGMSRVGGCPLTPRWFRWLSP
jgi:hypothetical protein